MSSFFSSNRMNRPHRWAAVFAAACFVAFARPIYSQEAADKAALELDAKIIADAAKTSEIMKNLGKSALRFLGLGEVMAA